MEDNKVIKVGNLAVIGDRDKVTTLNEAIETEKITNTNELLEEIKKSVGSINYPKGSEQFNNGAETMRNVILTLLDGYKKVI
jgi:hypothetical protein